MAENSYTVTGPDGAKFQITLPSPLKPPSSSRGFVHIAGSDVPIGRVLLAYEARTIGGRSLGFYASRADAASAVLKAAAWDTDDATAPAPLRPTPYKGSRHWSSVADMGGANDAAR
jgi:hypothetical protein